MTEQYRSALEYSEKWLELIKNPQLPSTETAHWIIEESTNNFAEHFNRNWLEYRKSVTESGQWASVEWTGRGARFQDVLGRDYIDFLGGYGMMSHGWANQEIIQAVNSQLLRTPMPSQELIDPLRGVLAKLLAEITPGNLKYSWFAGSGTEAIEAAIKIAKLYTGKSAFISSVKAFHGKTMGSLSLMGKADYREPLGQLYGGQVFHVPFGDADAVEKQLETCKKVGIGVAGVIMEPIQGEAGAIVPPDDYWPRLREITHKYGTLLIADEVQTGLGRTGALWGVNHWGVTPDILAVAKALGGGVMPVSAVCTTEEIFQPMMYPNPFMHTTTTGGGALACSAAIASINVTLKYDLSRQAAEKGAYIMKHLQDLKQKYPHIYKDVTGRGLLIGQHFHTPEIGYKVASALFKRGVLVAGTLTSAQTIRIEPPLVIEQGDIEEGLDRLNGALAEVEKTL